MSFLTDLAADLASIVGTAGDLAEAVTWNPAGYVPFAGTGVPSAGTVDQVTLRRSIQSDGDHLTLRCVAADVEAGFLASTGFARLPGDGDTVDLRGETYAVAGARTTAGGGCLVNLARRRLNGIGPAWGNS